VEIRLRGATPNDSEFLFDLHRVSLGDAVVATWGPWDAAQQREFHEAWFDPRRLLVVTCDGRDAGVLDIERRVDGSTYLARLELLPEFQSRGIGTQLVRWLVEQAHSDGMSSVQLDVLRANYRARRLYERLGFEIVSSNAEKHHMQLGVDTA